MNKSEENKQKHLASTIKHNNVENQTANMNFQSYQHQLTVAKFCYWHFVKYNQCLHFYNNREGYNLFLGTGLYGGPFLP